MLTTEKTLITIMPLAITNTCRVLTLYPTGCFVLFFTMFQLTVPYRASLERTAYHRDITEIPHCADKLSEIPWSSTVC